MVDRRRRAELRNNWDAETNDPVTTEWRDELTDEERALVAGWDEDVAQGCLRMCEDIIDLAARTAATHDRLGRVMA